MSSETISFLKKLDKINFTSYEDSTLIGTASDNTFNIRIRTEFSKSIEDIEKMAVQVILQVTANDVYIASWGASSEEANKEIIKWFVSHKSLARKANDELESKTKKETLAFFNSL